MATEISLTTSGRRTLRAGLTTTTSGYAPDSFRRAHLTVTGLRAAFTLLSAFEDGSGSIRGRATALAVSRTESTTASDFLVGYTRIPRFRVLFVSARCG